MEKDEEFTGSQSHYDFGARILDTRLGRWLSVDDVEKPHLTSYQFGGDNPVNNLDPGGNDEFHFHYHTYEIMDGEGAIHEVLVVDLTVIEDNKEHSFFIHNDNYPAGVATTQFHPLMKGTNLPNQSSFDANKADEPLAGDVSYFFGFGSAPIDDYIVLGRLLIASGYENIHEEYTDDVRKVSKPLKGSVVTAKSAEFAEDVLTVQETVYEIVDGYYLIKGITKYGLKKIVSHGAKKNADEIIEASTKQLKNETKPYAKSRPDYAKGQVDEVWENAKQADGKVYDPNTGEEIVWDKSKPRKGQWDMGHKHGMEYRKYHKDYMDGKITKDEFLKIHRDASHYQPEIPANNQSHKFEAK